MEGFGSGWPENIRIQRIWIRIHSTEFQFMNNIPYRSSMSPDRHYKYEKSLLYAAQLVKLFLPIPGYKYPHR